MIISPPEQGLVVTNHPVNIVILTRKHLFSSQIDDAVFTVFYNYYILVTAAKQGKYIAWPLLGYFIINRVNNQFTFAVNDAPFSCNLNTAI